LPLDLRVTGMGIGVGECIYTLAY
jgi:hypothetical protein